MTGGHHLWEVDHGHLVGAVEHEVELVEIAVDDPAVPEPDDQLHTLAVDRGRIRHLVHLTPAPPPGKRFI